MPGTDYQGMDSAKCEVCVVRGIREEWRLGDRKAKRKAKSAWHECVNGEFALGQFGGMTGPKGIETWLARFPLKRSMPGTDLAPHSPSRRRSFKSEIPPPKLGPSKSIEDDQRPNLVLVPLRASVAP